VLGLWMTERQGSFSETLQYVRLPLSVSTTLTNPVRCTRNTKRARHGFHPSINIVGPYGTTPVHGYA
jgi:hypothetical protein